MKKLLLIILILFSIVNISAQDAITIDQNGNVLFKLIDKTAPVDLKSAATPFDLSSYATVEKIGFRFRVSWFDGDGTNQFTFADSTPSYTIDNIAAAEWVGQGTGHLDLVYEGENNFEVINAGEVWDSDGLLFSDYKTFNKCLNGVVYGSGKAINVTTNSAIGNLFGNVSGTMHYTHSLQSFPISLVRVNTISVDSNARSSGYTNVTADTFLFTAYHEISSPISGCWQYEGRWTLSTPRKF